MSSGAETTAGAGEVTSKSSQPQIEQPANSSPSPVGALKSLEQEYIELLKEKITGLEGQLRDARNHRDNEAHSRETTKEKEEKEEVERGESGQEDGKSTNDDSDTKPNAPADVDTPGSKTRVRYIKRIKMPRTAPKDEVVTREDFKGTKIGNDGTEDDEPDVYAISWRQSWRKDTLGTPKLLIESKGLKAALKEVVQGHVIVSFDINEVKLKPPYEIIYHNAKALQEYSRTNPDCSTQTRNDIEILLYEVENEPQQRMQRLDARELAANGDVTYDLLWTLYCPGQLVYAPLVIGQDKYDQICLVQYVHIIGRSMELGLLGIDYDGFRFTYSGHSVAIDTFKGSRAISELEVVPLKWYKNAKGNNDIASLQEALTKRGRRFQELVTASIEQKHFHYNGTMVSEGRLEMVVDVGQGEDSSDRESAWTLASRSGESGQDEIARENTSVMVDHQAFVVYGGKDPSLGSTVAKYNVCSCNPCNSLRKKYLGELPAGMPPHLDQKQFMFCPPRVLGFNIKTKEWVQMLVENVTNISENGRRDAWDKLELASTSKNLLEHLVKQHDKMVDYVADLVPGKGKGLITLLHGPPGVGKTLTAESLAMLTARPLYSLSMSDIGSRPSTVEQNLLRIFELATHWRALLLFDEADVFLEKRSIGDLQRNGLVSVFIRLLEYYHGILFLTTNRLRTFDEAFQSRIQVALQYEDLQPEQCKRIWVNWLDKAGDDAKRNEIVEKLDEDPENLKLNGRQIRNTFRCAVALAKSEGGATQQLRWSHLEKALKTTIRFKAHMMQTNRQAEKDGLRWEH